MICLICRQTDLVDGLTSVRFERGEISVVVNNVPAHTCPGCREAYVEEDIAIWLLREVAAVCETGTWEAEIEYSVQRQTS